jgi:hypothetical protein
MWTFVDHDGVPPASNFAEQQIRHGVIWRKTSYGSDSQRGCLFAGRILTMVATCRQLARSVRGVGGTTTEWPCVEARAGGVGGELLGA